MLKLLIRFLWRAPSWTLALTFSSLLLILWQGGHSETYLPVAKFVLYTFTTGMHELIKNTVADLVGARGWMVSHPPTLATASHEVAYLIIFPSLLWVFGLPFRWFEHYFSKSSRIVQSWNEKIQTFLRNAAILLLAMLVARIAVFVAQISYSEEYIVFAEWLTSAYLHYVQASAEWVAAAYLPSFVLGFLQSNPLDVNHAAHVISGLIVTPTILVSLYLVRELYRLVTSKTSAPKLPAEKVVAGPVRKPQKPRKPSRLNPEAEKAVKGLFNKPPKKF